jgi:hypothetical protein
VCSVTGGLADRSLATLVGHPGRWHVVVDFGGYAGHVNASVGVCQTLEEVNASVPEWASQGRASSPIT